MTVFAKDDCRLVPRVCATEAGRGGCQHAGERRGHSVRPRIDMTGLHGGAGNLHSEAADVQANSASFQCRRLRKGYWQRQDARVAAHGVAD